MTQHPKRSSLFKDKSQPRCSWRRQMYLALGQEDTDFTMCPTCGMIYTAQLKTDKALHRVYHKRYCFATTPLTLWKPKMARPEACPAFSLSASKADMRYTVAPAQSLSLRQAVRASTGSVMVPRPCVVIHFPQGLRALRHYGIAMSQKRKAQVRTPQ